MKTMLVVALVLLSTISLASDFDCREGTFNDPQNGQFCHYTVPECLRSSCEEAALCMVNRYAQAISWEKFDSLKVMNKSLIEGSTEEVFLIKAKPRKKLIKVTLENFQKADGEIKCLPQAME